MKFVSPSFWGNVSVYDKDKKAVATILDTEDQQVFVPNVKKGEVYYLKLADQIKDEFVATICVKKDNVTPLQTNILYTQSGQDKNIYQEFKTDKRSSQSIYLKPSNYSNKNVTFYLQKKEKGVWKTITNRMIAVANDHKRVTFDTGLKKGEYRLVSNAATGQIYQIALQNQPVSNKYQTKKAKAQTIKKGKTVRNIYTTSEKAARWYKVKATKKILAVLAASVLAVSAFTACNSNSGNGSSSGTAGSTDTSSFDKTKQVTVITRENGSGTRDAFIELTGLLEKGSDGSKKDNTTASASTLNNTQAVMSGVAGNQYAIGYISLGSLNDTVKAFKVDGVEATAENVKNGTYKISRPFNIATKGEGDELTKDFISYILSKDGQDVITKEGYVSVVDDAKAYAGSKPAGKIVIAGSSSVSPVMEKLVEAYKQINTGAEIELQTQDSSSGIKAAISGTCQIAMSSRDLKDDEKESLTPQKIALDGIAVVGSTSNPTDNLTLDQIKGLYDGSITTWELK